MATITLMNSGSANLKNQIMKKIFLLVSYCMSALFFLPGCDKNEINYGVTDPVDGQAKLKINYESSRWIHDSVQLLVNQTRVSPMLGRRTPFPGGGYNTGGGSAPDYLSVNPGSTEISVSIPKKRTAKNKTGQMNTPAH